MNRHFFQLIVFVFIAVPTTTLTCVWAGDSDWPQWRGPHRDGHAASQSLLQDWPNGGPQLKWQCSEVGIGYSAFSIVDDRLFTMGTKGEHCYTICVDTKMGKLLWETIVSRSAGENDYALGWGGGPRSTPSIDGGFAYVLSDVGVLACLQTSDGKLVWSVDFVQKYGSSIPKWGYSESVLIDGDRVICTPGGESFMVGLDKTNGNQVWASQGISDGAQYVSPMKQTVGDVTCYVTASKSGLVGVDSKTGKVLFQDRATGNDVAVIPTPIVSENRLYHTSDYNAGNTLLRLSSPNSETILAEPVYHLSNKSMQNHHGGVILLDGVIYGFTKSGGGDWMAQDLETGETLWTEKIRPNRSGSISYADGRLYCYNDEEGSIILVEPSRDGWKKHGEAKLPSKSKIDRGSGAIWAHPIIAGQTLYLRDQDLLFAFDIARQ